MPARLIAMDGTADILIAGLLTVVGRHPGCDVLLHSSRVSRRHCCLALCGEDVLVRDLGSTNGIQINGLRVDEGLLRSGDILSIAHLRFRLGWQPDALDPGTTHCDRPTMDITGPGARSGLANQG